MVRQQGEKTLAVVFSNALISSFLFCGFYVLMSKRIKTMDCFFFFSTELFDNYMQQDAHEFLNYLLNTIADLLQEERKQEKTNGRLANGSLDSQNNNSNATPAPTWVHEIFQGTLTNETRCLTCETVGYSLLLFKAAHFITRIEPCYTKHIQICFPQISSKDEDFLDLSVDVEQNTSITHCLR